MSTRNNNSINMSISLPRFLAVSLTGIAVILSALAGLATTANAAPQGPWILPASQVSQNGVWVTTPQVAVAPDGTTTMVWVGVQSNKKAVQVSTRPPGGAFGPVVNLSDTAQDAIDPQIEVSPDGTATVVWSRFDGNNAIIQAATRPPGGAFAAAAGLSAPGQDAVEPELAAGADGTVAVVWRRNNGTHQIVQSATRAAGGSFGSPVNVSPPGQSAYKPQVVLAGDGTTTVAWSGYNGIDDLIQASTRPPGGAFGYPALLSAPGQDAFEPQIDLAADGAVTVVWMRNNGATNVIQAIHRAPGKAFGPPMTISDPNRNAVRPRIAVAAGGAATATWQGYDGANVIIHAAVRTSGGNFGTPANLSAAGQTAQESEVAVSADGTFTAVWRRSNGSHEIVQAAKRLPGQGFGPAVDLSETGQSAIGPQLAVDPTGVATAVWSRYNGVGKVAQAVSTKMGVVSDPGTDPDPDPGPGTDPGPDAESSAVLKLDPVMPRKPAIRRGGKVGLMLTAANTGDADALRSRLCLKAARKVRKALKPKAKPCLKLGTLEAGSKRTVRFRLRAGKTAKPGKHYRLIFRLSSDGNAPRKAATVIAVRR